MQAIFFKKSAKLRIQEKKNEEFTVAGVEELL